MFASQQEMKTTSMLLILFIIAILTSTSWQQAQNPNCQPSKVDKNYPNTLFIFVVETLGFFDPVSRYLMKQFACTIPNNDNIKLFVLDYSNDNIPVTINDANLYSSEQFVGKLATFLTGQVNTLKKCERMKTVQDKIAQKELVKNHKNVIYIAIHMEHVCFPDDVNNWFIVDITLQGTKLSYKIDEQLSGLFSTNDIDAKQFLKDEISKIVKKALKENDDVSPISASTSSESEKSGISTLGYILIGVGVIVGFVIGIIGGWVWKKLKSKKKVKKDDSEAVQKSDSKNKIESEKQPDPKQPPNPNNPPKSTEQISPFKDDDSNNRH